MAKLERHKPLAHTYDHNKAGEAYGKMDGLKGRAGAATRANSPMIVSGGGLAGGVPVADPGAAPGALAPGGLQNMGIGSPGVSQGVGSADGMNC